jgi:F0F1-type ATP synthase, subunit a
LTLIFGSLRRELHFTLFPPDVQIGSLNIPQSIVVSWVLMVILVIVALVIRIAVVSRFQDVPQRPLQNILEIIVEGIGGYTKKMSDVGSKRLSSYIFGLTVFMFSCTLTDFFGVRSPLTDLRLTGTLAVVTFLLLNYYGLRKKGLKGRMKSLASPTPAIMPIRMLSDLAAPVSLACRLFGNMVGGMIVIELVYVALGNFAAGIPAVLSLYFLIFEPVIQIYIFITLTLNYIREAVE